MVYLESAIFIIYRLTQVLGAIFTLFTEDFEMRKNLSIKIFFRAGDGKAFYINLVALGWVEFHMVIKL